MSEAARKPRLAVLLGDPAGVGPEMAVKLLAKPQNLAAADIVLIASRSALRSAERIAGTSLQPREVSGLESLRFEPGRATHWVQADPAAGEPPLARIFREPS